MKKFITTLIITIIIGNINFNYYAEAHFNSSICQHSTITLCDNMDELGNVTIL